MIKKRLIHLLEDSKKYILQNVLWQWLGLLAQILAVSAIGLLLEGPDTGKCKHKTFGRNSLYLRLFHSGALFL